MSIMVLVLLGMVLVSWFILRMLFLIELSGIVFVFVVLVNCVSFLCSCVFWLVSQVFGLSGMVR